MSDPTDDELQHLATELCVADGQDPMRLTYHTVEPGVQEPYGDMWVHYLPQARAAYSHFAQARTDRDAFRADHIASANENAALRAKVAALETVLMPFASAGQWVMERALNRTILVIRTDINGPDQPVSYNDFVNAAKAVKS